MTQQHVYRMASFVAGSLPDAETLINCLIIEESLDGTGHTLLQSDGILWLPVGGTPQIATTAAAIEGLENFTFITPLRLAEVLAAKGISSSVPGENGYVSAGYVTSGYVHA